MTRPGLWPHVSSVLEHWLFLASLGTPQAPGVIPAERTFLPVSSFNLSCALAGPVVAFRCAPRMRGELDSSVAIARGKGVRSREQRVELTEQERRREIRHWPQPSTES